MKKELLHSCPELIDYINETGFLPLLSMDINGWSAEEVVDEDCQYTRLPDGGWEWPLWEWKGAILQESGCAYGKFFKDKAAFISREWWPDFCNYRRSVYPYPEAGSIEESILDVLKKRRKPDNPRAACCVRIHGTKDAEPFRCIYHPSGNGRLHRYRRLYLSPRSHGKEYGWGWSLLTTPETLFGREACHPDRTPQESRERILRQLKKILPDTSEKIYDILLK